MRQHHDHEQHLHGVVAHAQGRHRQQAALGIDGIAAGKLLQLARGVIRGHAGADRIQQGHEQQEAARQQPGQVTDAAQPGGCQRQDQHAAQRIGTEHVAAPDQKTMQQADQQQPAQPPLVGSLRGLPAAQLLPERARMQRKAGAEQEGKDGVELELGKGRHQEDGGLVQPWRRCGQGAVAQGQGAPGKAPYIDQQDAEHGDAAQHIELRQPARPHAHRLARARVG